MMQDETRVEVVQADIDRAAEYTSLDFPDEIAALAQIMARHRTAFAASPAGERVKHAWDAGYSTGQTYAQDPPFAGLGKHNRQHGWELYACSLTDRNLVAHPLPADREAIARIMYERFVEENGGFFNEKNGCGFGTWDELSDKSIWLSAAGFVLALWPTPSAGRDGSGSTVPIAMIIPSLEGARATLQHFAETLADSEPRKLPLAAAFAASEASRLAAAIMLLSPPSTEKGEK